LGVHINKAESFSTTPTKLTVDEQQKGSDDGQSKFIDDALSRGHFSFAQL
jgi:hypothetical protein